MRGKTIAVLGLTFKPETDDMRDAPSLPIVHRLAEEGAKIRVFDPEGMEPARPMLPEGVAFCTSATEALEGANAMVLVTEWNEFRAISPEKLATALRDRIVVDLRNVFDPAAMAEAGLQYFAVGRGSVVPGAGHPHRVA